MRDCNKEKESAFFKLLSDFFDSEKDAAKQHDPANYSLDRMFPLVQLVGNPEKHLKIIHIAGTKGKGTTSQFTSALLESAGKNVGLFTSPHLATVRERFQFNNRLVSYEYLTENTQELADKIRQAHLTPSLFELFTVLALKMFVDKGMEYAVLETGIGGRLDATNYISHPELTIITPISFDHIALLGNTIEQIASEKAGIIKPNIPVLISRQPYPEAENVLRIRAQELNAPVLTPSSLLCCEDFLPETYPLFLKENFSSAFAAVKYLQCDTNYEAFRLPRLRARFEKIQDNPMVLLDGAHNGDSMEKLVNALNTIYPTTEWNVVLGSVVGKDIQGIVNALAKLKKAHFILTNPHTSKISALPALTEAVRAAGLDIRSIIPNLQSKEQLPLDIPLLFTGSFFTANIGEDLFTE